jgi:hypothetical protein
MNKTKYKITLYNENQYNEKIIEGKPIKYTTVCNIYNNLVKPSFNLNPHYFKCCDSFSIKDNRIRLIVFCGNKIDMIVYNDGFVKDKDLFGKYELIN